MHFLKVKSVVFNFHGEERQAGEAQPSTGPVVAKAARHAISVLVSKCCVAAICTCRCPESTGGPAVLGSGPGSADVGSVHSCTSSPQGPHWLRAACPGACSTCPGWASSKPARATVWQQQGHGASQAEGHTPASAAPPQAKACLGKRESTSWWNSLPHSCIGEGEQREEG